MRLLHLAFRNLRRDTWRTGLTIFAITICTLVFSAIQAILTSMNAQTDLGDVVFTRHKQSILFPLPGKYLEHVRAMPNVAAATSYHWLGGKSPTHLDADFEAFAVDPPTFFEVFQRFGVAAAESRAWVEDPQGALIDREVAVELGWKIGDRVTLESSYNPAPPEAPWTFNVRAFYDARTPDVPHRALYFNWKYFNDSMPADRRDMVQKVASRPRSGSSADLARSIDREFEETEIRTVSTDAVAEQRANVGRISPMLRVFQGVAAIVALISFLVLGNTLAMGVRERGVEYGMLRAVGFGGGDVLRLIAVEAMLTGVVGATLGVLLGWLLSTQVLGPAIVENMQELMPTFHFHPALGVGVIVVAAVLSAIIGILPGLGVVREPVTQSLRRVA